MHTGCLPYDWTTANIVPVFKKNDKHLPSNYRPISLTSIVVKVMEQIIRSRLIKALSNNNRFCDSQHGFRSSRSTVSLLLQAVDDWSLCQCFRYKWESSELDQIVFDKQTLACSY